MIENDTVKLLRECDAGIEMGISTIGEVLDYVGEPQLRRSLERGRDGHVELRERVSGMLADYHDGGKSPNPMAKGMSWVKTNVKLAANDSDKTIADLVTDGCNMGIKSLNRYLNQYPAADSGSKEVTKRLIGVEQQLADDIRSYL